MNAGTLIGLTAAPEHREDFNGENVIFNNARARRSTDSFVLFTTQNFKHVAKRSD